MSIKAFYPDGVTCHLCGLPIPEWVTNSTHPLFGTIDHLIPKSKGGLDRAENRAPAHRCCNSKRSSHDISGAVQAACLGVVRPHFKRLTGVPKKSKRWREVRKLQGSDRRTPTFEPPEQWLAEASR